MPRDTGNPGSEPPYAEPTPQDEELEVPAHRDPIEEEEKSDERLAYEARVEQEVTDLRSKLLAAPDGGVDVLCISMSTDRGTAHRVCSLQQDDEFDHVTAMGLCSELQQKVWHNAGKHNPFSAILRSL